jgi:hypothetical protein
LVTLNSSANPFNIGLCTTLFTRNVTSFSASGNLSVPRHRKLLLNLAQPRALLNANAGVRNLR